MGCSWACACRGETVDEIAGAVSVMRSQDAARHRPVMRWTWWARAATPPGLLQHLHLRVVHRGGCRCRGQHGNPRALLKSGAAIALAAPRQRGHIGKRSSISAAFQAGIGFMFAPSHHPAAKHVGPTRVEMGTRTIFNSSTPLSIAGMTRQVVGVVPKSWMVPLARGAENLGSERAFVVHGSDGLDEITISGTTDIAVLENGKIPTFQVTREDVGLSTRPGPEGGDAKVNAAALTAVLDGARNAYRDVSLFNAAATLVVAGHARTCARAWRWPPPASIPARPKLEARGGFRSVAAEA